MFRLAACLALLVASTSLTAQDADPTYDGKKASEWVKILQDNSSARQRSLAVGALAKLWSEHRYKESIPMIGRALRLDPSVAVRTAAASALGALKLEDAKYAASDLVESLKVEKEPRVRKEVAVSLGRYPVVAKLAIAPLTGALKDADAPTRAAAADTLARVGPEAKAAAPDLLALLKDSDKAVRHAAVFALGRIGPDDTATVAAAFTKLLESEKDADLRRELIVSLGLLGERTQLVVGAIAAWLHDPDAETRRVAARTLNTFGAAARPAADRLLELVTKMDKGARAYDKDLRLDGVRGYCSALGPALKEHLAKLLPIMAEDPDFEVRLAIVEEIGALGGEILNDKTTIEALRVRQSDPQVKVREAAASAIRRITKKPSPVPPKKP